MPESHDIPEGTFARESRGLEFERVAFFSDAVYAIAMTLLVVDIKVPNVSLGNGEGWPVLTALREEIPEIVGFFLCFWLIGITWLNHHRFIASLRTIGRTLMTLNMFYLAFVAFMPVPVALISHYENNLTSFLMFVGSLAIISTLSLIMFVVAYRLGRTRETVTRAVFDHGVVAGALPVAVFLLSIPVALIQTTYGLLFCFLVFPAGRLLRLRAHPDVHRYLRTGG